MKLAPLSVPYRAAQKAGSAVVAAFFISAGGGGTVLSDYAPLLAVAAVLLALAYEIAYYRRFEYELTEDTFDVVSGVVSRRDREIPYRRIQNVDISRGVVQRLLGLAAVDLETAGGSSTEGSIRYVTPAEAERLRTEIQRRKAGAAAGEPAAGSRAAAGADAEMGAEAADAASGAPAETELFAISPSELALVGALSFDPRLLGLVAFLASGSVPVLSGIFTSTSAVLLSVTGLFLAGALLFASWLLGAAIAVTNYYGFRLTRSGDELRYERGLFRRYSGSIPTEKVQSIAVTDNPLKRLFGYATLTIETAGYAPGQGGDYGSQAAVPLAKTGRVYELAREVEAFGEPDFTRPPGRIRVRYAVRYATVVLALTGIAYGIDRALDLAAPWGAPLALLALVPVAAHYKWVHRGYWLGEDHLLTRSGFWRRQTRVVPYYRLQTVIDSRTLFQRRWGVATVVADTAGTGSFTGGDAVAPDVAADEADALREGLTDRLRRALAERRERDRSAAGRSVDGETDSEAETDGPTDEPTDADRDGFEWPSGDAGGGD
ncbi:PH domain-containing protein [Haloparvum sedimenti]|uniref:PH domain-containing protein n=1 Tax=Haloparvum sedimenti TaxID=1678448 RepID=UPI00071E6CF9|nr:PH domain-containing protein [Haloparvum sedimenti]